MAHNHHNSVKPDVSDTWSQLVSSCSWYSGVATLQGSLEGVSVQYVLDSVSPTTWMYLAGGAVLLGLIYYYLIIPNNHIFDMTEIGCDAFVGAGATRRGPAKQQMVREARRLKKIGNLPPVFPNGWFVLLESDDLKPGQVKHVAALGENFAIFRTMEGAVHILDAYCPHLGANMAIGGVVKGDCLQCPFHAWQFRGEDGKCVSIPYTEKVPELAKVKRWKSCEINCSVFVWYHVDGEEPTWQIEPNKSILNKECRYRRRNEYWMNVHIQDISENGSDVTHLFFVHDTSVLAGSELGSLKTGLWSFARHEWDVKWTPCTEQHRLHTASIKIHHEIRLFGIIPLIQANIGAKQIGPGYTEMTVDTALGRIVILQCVTPIEPMLQRVVHRVFCSPLISPFSNFIVMFDSIMIARDAIIWSNKSYADNPILVKEDSSIAQHRRWYNQFYSENSTRFSFVKETTDW